MSGRREKTHTHGSGQRDAGAHREAHALNATARAELCCCVAVLLCCGAVVLHLESRLFVSPVTLDLHTTCTVLVVTATAN